MLFDHDYDRVLTFLSFVLFLGITIFLSSCLYMLFISIIFVHTWVLVMGLVGLYRDGIPQRGNVRKESILLLDDDDYGKNLVRNTNMAEISLSGVFSAVFSLSF